MKRYKRERKLTTIIIFAIYYRNIDFVRLVFLNSKNSNSIA